MGAGPSVGRFVLESPVGVGGMGQVWRARHPPTSAVVAVKIVGSVRAHREIQREVRAMAALDHPGVARVLDLGTLSDEAAARVGVPPGSPWMALELLSGALSEWCGRLQGVDARDVLTELLRALAHAHGRGVLHRDLKPANVLIAGGDPRAVRLADFGIARSLREAGADRIAGTPSYMAPEQRAGRWRDEGPWTDLFAVACIARALVTGAPDGTLLPGPARAWLRDLQAPDPAARCPSAAAALAGLLQVPPDGFAAAGAGSPEQGTTWSTALGLEPDGAASGAVAPRRVYVAPPWPEQPPEARAADPPLADRVALWGLRPLRFVAREEERALLWAALREAARSERPAAVVLRGAVGSGTSRLATWLACAAREHGVAEVIEVAHGPFAAPGHGLSELAAGVVGSRRADRAAALSLASRWLSRRGVGEGLARTAMAELAAPPDPNAPFAFGGEQARWHAGLELLRRVGRPVLVVLDDAHLSADTVRFVARVLSLRDAPVLFVLTAQPTDRVPDPWARAALEALRSHADCRELVLGPVRAEARPALYREALGLCAPLAAHVDACARGNLLCALALVEDLLDAEALESTPQGLVTPDGLPVLPRDVQALFADRLERALDGRSEPEAAAVELAAALGAHIRWDEWRAAAGPAATPQLVEQLVAHRLARHDEGGWSFSHSVARRIALRRAARGGRLAAAHATCADALRSSGRAPARVGRHLLSAGRHAEALDVLLEVARSAARTDGAAAALDLLALAERALVALDLAPDDPRHGRLAYARIDILGLAGRVHEVSAQSRALADRAAVAGWSELHRSALCRLVPALRFSGALEQAEGTLAQLEALVDRPGGDPYARAVLERERAWCLSAAGDPGAGLRAAERALELARGADSVSLVGDVLRTVAYMASRLDEDGRASDALREAREAAMQQGHHALVASVAVGEGRLALKLGDLDASAEAFELAEALFEALANGNRVVARYYRARVELERGDLAACMALARSTRDVAAQLGWRALEQGARTVLAVAAALCGDEGAFDEAQVSALDCKPEELELLARAAAAWQERGDTARADEARGAG